MKKINEDVTIVDPALAQQYANAQKQILDKDKQINNLQRQVNALESQKVQLHQAMVAIEQKAAQSQQQPVKRTETSSQQEQGDQTQLTSESLESFENILIVEEEDEEPRFTGRPTMNPGKPGSVYFDGKHVGTEKIDLIKKRGAKGNPEKETELENKVEEIRGEIENLRSEIKSKLEPFMTPSYEGIEGEIENFWGEISPEALEILNSGVYTGELEILKALEKAGVEHPKEVLGNYYYYFPEYNRNLDMDRVEVEEEVEEIKKSIGMKEKELQELESEYENTLALKYDERKRFIPLDKEEPLEEEFEDDSFPSKDIWHDEEDELSDEDVQDWSKWVSPEDLDNWDEEGNMTIDYDEENSENPASYKNFWGDLDEDVDEKKTREDYLDDSFLFYTKIVENGKPFIGKIFKISPDSDWNGVVKVGESSTFEKITYETEYDELDIIEFLKDNYEDVEILDRHEYNEYFLDTEHEEVIENIVEGSSMNIGILKDKIEKFNRLVRESVNDNTNFLFIFGEKGNEIHEQYLKHDTFESFWESLDMDHQYELYNWLEHTSFMNEESCYS